MIKRFLHSSPSSPSGQDPSAALLPSQPSIDACAGEPHVDARRPAASRTACLLDGAPHLLQQQLTLCERPELHRCGGTRGAHGGTSVSSADPAPGKRRGAGCEAATTV